jgi:carbamoyltransferase
LENAIQINENMKIISIHTQHDANITISVNYEIVLVLELERIFRKRYFESSNNEIEFENEWQKAIDISTEFANIQNFDIAITNWVVPSKLRILKKIINAAEWITCDHHLAHAALGFYDSGFTNPLILSFDGGGNDGVFNFYHITNNKIHLIERSLLNLGAAFRLLGSIMPEITNNIDQPRGGHISLSGKIMGYSALGTIQSHWIDPLLTYYKFYQYPMQALYSLSQSINIDLEETAKLDNETARNLAATSQKALEIIVINKIKEKVIKSNYDGIVLTGGVALNVINNTLIKETFDLPVHIPSAPNDCGISLGSIYAKFPSHKKQNITYLGLPLHNNVQQQIIGLGQPFTLKLVASLLVNEDAIIGVARDRSEVGPRALGNRSILCYPDNLNKKGIINDKIKFREWYRPLAPVIKQDKCELFFGKNIYSPYMSFAYKFREELQGKFPTVEHLDKTARLQTVSKSQNVWIYTLLDEVETLTGFPILLNTSFNIKGKPLLSDSFEAVEILRDTELTHVIINDLIFSKEMLIQNNL